jgi:hypothetical protein
MAANPALAISPVLDAMLDQVRIDAGGRSGAIGDLQIEAANRREFRARLARTLYCRWHMRTTAPDDEPIKSRRDLTLEKGLTAAVPHAFTMASGRLTGTDPDRPDQLLVDRSGVRTWVPAHAVCTPGPFTAGQTISLLVPPVRPMLSPGFFLADGARGTAPDGRLCRVYLHIRDADDAVTTWRAALQVLEKHETRYRAKVVSASPLPERADGMTVYLDRDDTTTIAGLAGLDRGSRPRPVSIFAEQVGNGIATADEPDDPRPGMRDLSFGEHRARVIADSLTWHAITRASPREAAVVTALLDAGIDPANPARNTSRPTHEKELSDDHHRTRVRIRQVHQRRRIRHRITGHGAAEHDHHRHRQGLTVRPRCGASCRTWARARAGHPHERIRTS